MRSAELPSGYTIWSVWKELHPESGWLDPASLPARSAGGRGRGGGQTRQLPEGFERPEGADSSGGQSGGTSTRQDWVDQGQG